jgi:TRAP-type C4-dicarboxylate transport system permease small subunit
MRDRLARIIAIAAALLLIAAVAMMTVQVTLRTLANAPMTWAEEVVRYAFVWCVYLGTVLATINDTQIRVLVAVEGRGPRAMAISDGLTRLVNLICFAYLAYWGFDLAMKYRSAGFYTLPSLPILLFYLSLPLCSALAVIFLLLPGQKPVAAEPQEGGD